MLTKKYLVIPCVLFVLTFFAALTLYFGFSKNLGGDIGVCHNFKREALPLPIDKEFREFKTNAFLTFYNKKYNTYLFSDEAYKLDPEASQFKSFAQSFMDGDYQYVFNSSADGALNTLEEAEAHLKLFNSAFGKYNKFKLISQVCLGGERIFLWSINLKGKEYVRSFSFIQDDEGNLKYSYENSNLPFAPLLRKIFQFSIEKNIDFYKKNTNESSYPIKRNELPVIWINSRGAAFDYNFKSYSFGEGGSFLQDAVESYVKIYEEILNGNRSSFLKRMTPKSSTKAQAWINSMSDLEFQSYLDSVRSRKIFYAISADPFVIIFYKEWAQGAAEPVLRYEYVIQEKRNSEFLLTNFYYEDFLDDFLKNREAFLNYLQGVASVK